MIIWLKNFVWLPLALFPFCSCFIFSKEGTEHVISRLVGFASDTTAIMFKYNWETSEDLVCAFEHVCYSTDYIDLELKLVDVRFKKIYWLVRIRNKNYGEYFWTRQLNDSTILIRGGKNYILWKVGDSGPQKIILNGSEEYNIDTTWHSWDLVVNKDSCSFSLLSENGDTLSSFNYAYECNNFDVNIHRYFIQVYPIRNANAMFRYDKEGNIAPKPAFWMYVRKDEFVEFIDSLGNVVRYD